MKPLLLLCLLALLTGLSACRHTGKAPVELAAASNAPPPALTPAPAATAKPVVPPLALVPPRPADPYFAKFSLLPAPQPTGLLLRKGDRLAICGDSITEQNMYSRAMETYVTVCVPELAIEVRQFGWSGEKAPDFLARMTNDCLRFKPTFATTCYGMNDHGYVAYQETIGQKYRDASSAIVRAFKDNDVRVVLGSPGCIGNVWQSKATSDEMNLNLCALRNLGMEIALDERVGFADVFWTMLHAGREARQKYGANYAIAGVDGVHPGWAGSFVMAYAFLRSLGLDGEIGAFTVDLKADRARATAGHEVISCRGGEIVLRSSRYPFCATGAVDKDDNIRSAMALVPFNSELNRLLLVARGGAARNYRVTWGGFSRTYASEQLSRGVNLAEDFAENPFFESFTKVDRAVAAKQAYETKQIKQFLRSPEARVDMEGAVARTEKERNELVAAIQGAFVPVTHTIKIEPL